MNLNFNDRLDILKGKDPAFSSFFAAAKTAANQTCMKSQYKSKPWFEYSKDALQPFVDEQYRLLRAIREAGPDERDELTEQLKVHNRLKQIRIEQAKSDWNLMQASRVGCMDGTGGIISGRDMFKAINEISQGTACNHVKPKPMNLIMPNGNKTTTDRRGWI